MNQEDIKTMVEKYYEVTGNKIKDISTDLEFATWAAGWQGGMEAERAACEAICTVWQQTEYESDTAGILASEIRARGEKV